MTFCSGVISSYFGSLLGQFRRRLGADDCYGADHYSGEKLKARRGTPGRIISDGHQPKLGLGSFGECACCAVRANRAWLRLYTPTGAMSTEGLANNESRMRT
jgi:hypothetical protein